VPVYIQPELVIAKEELVFAGAEHPHWTTRFTTFGKFLMARIVTLWYRDTLEIGKVHNLKAFRTEDGDPGLQEDEVIRLGW